MNGGNNKRNLRQSRPVPQPLVLLVYDHPPGNAGVVDGEKSHQSKSHTENHLTGPFLGKIRSKQTASFPLSGPKYFRKPWTSAAGIGNSKSGRKSQTQKKLKAKSAICNF